MKSVTTQIILDKLLEERLVVGAIILSIILLITSGTALEQAGTQESDFRCRKNLTR